MTNNTTAAERASIPTRAGQMVKGADGTIGITTDQPMKRTPRIGVMFVGASYPVLTDIADLEVIKL